MTVPNSRRIVRNKVIGVAVVAGILGLAVETREHLERVESHRVRAPEDIVRLAAHLAVLVARFGCTAFAVAVPAGVRRSAWVDDLRDWCGHVARLSGYAVTTYNPVTLRREIAGNTKQPANWRLMDELARRHPSLRPHTRAHLPATMPRYQVQKRERYWTPAFLALAAADRYLADALVPEQPIS